MLMTCVSVLIKVSTNVQEDCCCMQYVSGWITVMQLRVAHSWNSGFGGLICSFPLHYLTTHVYARYIKSWQTLNNPSTWLLRPLIINRHANFIQPTVIATALQRLAMHSLDIKCCFAVEDRFHLLNALALGLLQEQED